MFTVSPPVATFNISNHKDTSGNISKWKKMVDVFFSIIPDLAGDADVLGESVWSVETLRQLLHLVSFQLVHSVKRLRTLLHESFIILSLSLYLSLSLSLCLCLLCSCLCDHLQSSNYFANNYRWGGKVADLQLVTSGVCFWVHITKILWLNEWEEKPIYGGMIARFDSYMFMFAL